MGEFYIVLYFKLLGDAKIERKLFWAILLTHWNTALVQFQVLQF